MINGIHVVIKWISCRYIAKDFTIPDEKINVQAKMAPINSVSLRPSTKENTNPQINPRGNPFKKNQSGHNFSGVKGISKSGITETKSKIEIVELLFFRFKLPKNEIPKNLLHV